LQASAILSHRGLKLAAKWAAEQVVGIPVGPPASLRMPPPPQPHEDEESNMNVPQQSTSDRIQLGLQEELLNMNEQDWYAKSLMDLGEFLHAASVLSQDLGGSSNNHRDTNIHHHSNNTTTSISTAAVNINTADITQMGPPLPGLSSFGFYVRAYALFMAGERRKEEEYAGLQGYVARIDSTIDTPTNRCRPKSEPTRNF
jgi:hypothetical protein